LEEKKVKRSYGGRGLEGLCFLNGKFSTTRIFRKIASGEGVKLEELESRCVKPIVQGVARLI
jgi:hypothetical protein